MTQGIKLVLTHDTLIRPNARAKARLRLLNAAAARTAPRYRAWDGIHGRLPGAIRRGAAYFYALPALVWHEVWAFLLTDIVYDPVCSPFGMSHHFTIDRYVTFKRVTMPA